MKVWNKRDPLVPKDAVYIGRPSKWGNPFSHMDSTLAQFKVSSRDEAVEAYRNWLVNDSGLLGDLGELRGKDLVCWCAPAKCHGDILMELANK